MAITNIKYSSEKHIDVWPKFPSNSQLLVNDMLNQCLELKGKSADEIYLGQMEQLNVLLGYAKLNSPFYAKLLSGTSIAKADDLSTVWGGFPVLTLDDIARNGQKMALEKIPSGHGAKQNYPIMIPGQSAVPAMTTSLWFIFLTAWIARIFHEHEWDQSATLVELHAGNQDVSKEVPGGWGVATESGKRISGQVTADSNQLPNWLNEIDDDFYVMTGADLLPFVMRNYKADKLSRLKAIIVYIKSASDMDAFEKVKDTGLSIIPVIMVPGLGVVASACPEAGKLHINSEAMLFEEVNGRAVISILHNYAMPLIRFDCGLPIHVTENCSCGRGSQTVEFNP